MRHSFDSSEAVEKQSTENDTILKSRSSRRIPTHHSMESFSEFIEKEGVELKMNQLKWSVML